MPVDGRPGFGARNDVVSADATVRAGAWRQTKVARQCNNPTHDIMRPNTAVLVGFILALPFAIANVIVATRMEPLYSFLDSLGFISSSPFPAVMILIAIGLAGSFVAAWPMLRKDADGRRKFYLLNAVVAVVLFVGFFVIGIELGEEVYRCDVLGIPNCD
jgi:cytochrome c biogenesis factor